MVPGQTSSLKKIPRTDLVVLNYCQPCVAYLSKTPILMIIMAKSLRLSFASLKARSARLEYCRMERHRPWFDKPAWLYFSPFRNLRMCTTKVLEAAPISWRLLQWGSQIFVAYNQSIDIACRTCLLFNNVCDSPVQSFTLVVNFIPSLTRALIRRK